MRKFATLLAAAAFIAGPLAQSAGAVAVQPRHTVTTSTDHVGPWAIACGAAAVLSPMIGTEIKANDPDHKKRRQLTITEATWYASACPFLLPFAIVATATCPDNKATYEVARLAFLFVAKHPGADQSAFTNAYGEACRTGKLSRATWRGLRHLI